MARPLRVARDLLPPMVARIALAGLGAVLLAVAASSWLAGRLVRPVKDLSVAASRIARGHLDQKVEVVSSDEFGQLAGTFNEMSTALTEAQRREREFLASVSHELRTPITAIKGYAEALQEGALTDEAARGEALAIIQDESDRLERMVRDVMDLARLGARNFQLDLREADLAVTLADAMRAHGAQAEDAGVTLSEDIATPMTATTDPDRVRQVVSNLIENALRVSGEESEVRVTGSMDGTDAVIEIADHGPGIGADDLPHVFERSYLWRSVKGSQPVGTGLGLAIVRELVGALGGTISVGSEVGRGTTFRLRIPITPTIDA